MQSIFSSNHLPVECLSLSSIRPSIGTENPIPEEMDYREIAVRVPVMNEVQFLFPPEPCKPLKPRSLYVVFLVEKDVRVKRRAHATSQKAARVLSRAAFETNCRSAPVPFIT